VAVGLVALVLSAAAVAGFIAWDRRRPVTKPGERSMRTGAILVVVGLIWTVVAWWAVIPELVLAAGLVMMTVGRWGS
jgi:hypothetical protein